MSDSLLRQLVILHYLPEYPAKVSTRDLLRALDAQGITATIRTVQRDMESLSLLRIFGVAADKASKPIGWFRIKQTKRLQIPFMDRNTAIAFELIESQADSLLPTTIRQQLAPLFDAARSVINDGGNWSKKIIRPNTNQPSRGTIKPVDRDLIYEALDKNRCIAADIGRVHDGIELQYFHYRPLHPVGLIVNNDDVQLILHTGNKVNFVHAALHRIRNVELLEQNAVAIDSDLKGVMDGLLNEHCFAKNIELELDVDKDGLRELLIHPLSSTQEISAMSNGRCVLTARVDDNKMLRRRLINLGHHIVVIRPLSLRHLICTRAQKILQGYSSPKLISQLHLVTK